MSETGQIKFMRRCLELASKAEGLTYPNPMVGSVLVHDNKIVGEGYHLKAGGPHAEVIAINSVANKEILKTSTLYVNLEPCSHFGKTPPCADFIISWSVPRVVIGTPDPSDKVSGRGIEILRSSGCEVITGVIEEECRRLNRRFITFHEKRRPYITLKWAQSADGFLDVVRTENHKNEPTWISGKSERVLVHKWRASEQAILVGAGTVRADNPKLNVREWEGNNPLKLILSSSGLLNEGSFSEPERGNIVVFTHNTDTAYSDVIRVILNNKEQACIQICDYLFRSGIQSLFVEGGSQTLNHFIANGIWDEARVFKGKVRFMEGVRAPSINGKVVTNKNFDGSSLDIYLNGS